MTATDADKADFHLKEVFHRRLQVARRTGNLELLELGTEMC
jgi:hypothetical protein